MKCAGKFFASLLLVVVTGCSNDAHPPAFPIIHQVEGGASEVFANAYIIEGENGVVVVDALLTRAASRDLRRRVDAIGKPLHAVVLTHGHPDHYGGVAQLIEGMPEAPVIAIAGVDAVIRRDDADKGERLAALEIDWAPRRTFPDTIAPADRPLRFGEFTLTPIDFGEGESDHDSVWVLRGPTGVFLFTGDLVMNGVHAYAADAHTEAWLASLERLATRFDNDAVGVFPGHGAPGDRRLIATQRAYLDRLRSEVADIAQHRGSLTNQETQELERRMVNFLGHDRMSRWIHEAADPVAAELADAHP